MDDADPELAAAIAASLADLAPPPPPRAASPDALVVLSDDDEPSPPPKLSPLPRKSSTPSSTGRGRGKAKHTPPPPPSETELDAVFVALSGGRDTITRASLAAASATILGDGALDDDLNLMLLLAYELGGGGTMGEMGRGEFGVVAKRVLGG
jgi:hypothetical protein